ncbi:hypothetical protein GCM10010129_27330 [Streptomyces fumigatiscleroticus]|nr:hypothetical protein GCM10010129_27330 [Streptomyces fumigatiscleroticus]
MNDQDVPPYDDQDAVWSRLAALLPSAEDAEEVLGCYEIGEQEAGLLLLVDRLVELGVAVSGPARAEIAVLAQDWAVWDRIGDRLVTLPADRTHRSGLRVFADGAGEPLPAASVLPDGAPEELFLVPWIACADCGRVLLRGHLREWYGLFFLPRCYVVRADGHADAPRVFDTETDDDAVWHAFGALRASCACA